MSTYTTTGLVLSSHDFLEADKIFSIYTNTHGKIEVRATGVRKIKSKLRAHLEPFSITHLMIAHGRRIDRLASAINQKNYKKIKQNYQLLTINYQLLEITDQLTKHHHPDKRIFDLLVEVFNYSEKLVGKQCNNVTMKQLNNDNSTSYTSNQNKNLLAYFVLNFLALLGYKPELNFCVRCKSQVKKDAFFSFRDGSIICSRCKKNDTKISPETLDVLKKYLTQNLEQCCNLAPQESGQLITEFLNHHLDRPLKSNLDK